MKTSFGKKIAIICLSAAVACGMGVGINSIRNVEADAQAYNVDTILDLYGVNTTIKVTDDSLSDVEVTKGYKAFPKTHNIGGEAGRKATIDVLTYPDGIVKKVGETFTLSQVGKYTISYKLVEGGVTSVYYDTFKVNNSFYTLSADTGTKVAKSIFTDIATIDGLTEEQINEIISINNLVERDAISDANIKAYFGSKSFTMNDLSSALIAKIITNKGVLARHAITQDQVNLYLAADGIFKAADNVKTSYPISKFSDTTIDKIVAKYSLNNKSEIAQEHLVDYFAKSFLDASELTDAQKQDIKAKFNITGDTISALAIENYFKGYFLNRDRLSSALINKIKNAFTLDSNSAVTQDVIDAYFRANVIVQSDLTDAQAKVIVDAYGIKDIDALTQEHINSYLATVAVVNADLTDAQAQEIIAQFNLTKPMAITKDHIDTYFGDKFPRKDPGVQLTLTAGTEVSINEAVDLDELQYDDNGLADLITFNPVVMGPGGYEDVIVEAFDIKFTDVNNPNNYFVARIANSKSVVGFGFGTYTDSLPLYGATQKAGTHIVEKADGSIRVLFIDGVRTVFYLEKTAGMGQGHAQRIDYTVAYNPVKQEVHVRALEYNYETGTRRHISTIPIGFLNNAALYGENAKLFNGFSTNQFTVSIKPVNLAASSCDFDIYKIGNMSGADLMERYDINNIEDTTNPIVKIDVDATDVAGIYGVVGSKFAIPNAEVIDANPINDISVKVYKNYESANPIYVALNNDNTFTIAEKAAYTIEYTAYDKYGNKGVNTLKVNPVNLPELVAGDNVVNNEFSLVFDNPELKTGTTCTAPIFKHFDTINSRSATKLNVTVSHAGSNVFSKDYVYADFADGIPTFDFTPISSGDYTFTYTYSDNINSASKSVNVSCVASNEYRIIDEPFVNRAYILGATYQAPVLEIYKFAQDIELIPATPYVSYDNGATWTKINKTFKVGYNGSTAIEGVTSAMFKFELEGSGLAPYITDAKPIIDVRLDGSTNEITYTGKNANLDMRKFFTYDDALINIVPDDLGTALVFKSVAGAGSAKFSYINPLTYNDRSEFLSIISTRNALSNFTAITYILTDAHDSNNKLTITLETIGTDSTISLNGGAKASLSTGIFNTDANKVNANYNLTLKYNFVNKLFSYGGAEFTVDFTPKKNMFYVDFVIEGITGTNAGIIVNSLGNQQMSTSSKVDTSNAHINYISSVGSYSLGTKLVISAPVAADILTPVLNENLAVKVNLGTKKNSPFVKDVNGVLLDGTQDPTKDYVISIDEFDTYKVTYEATDAAGKITSSSYRISGVDLVGPTITLNYGFTKDTIHNVTLGKPFSIEYKVTDDNTPEDKIMKYVVLINDETLNIVFSRLPQEVTNGKYDLITDTCTITRKGMYTLYIYAMDESRNASIASYKVNVQ